MNKKKLAVILVATFILGAMVGGEISQLFFPNVITKIQSETKTKTIVVPVVEEKVITQTKTQIQYVPKEVVKIVELDGKVIEQKEKTDVEVNAQQPTVNVKVNGKEHEFELEQGETQKFENGKLVLDQESKIQFEIKQRPAKDLAVGVFAGEGYGLTLKYKDVGIDISLEDCKNPKIDRIKFDLYSF